MASGDADHDLMADPPRFIVTFHGVEIGRYENADHATAAARSVLDAEAGSRFGSGPVRESIELPKIEYQPPRVPVPFDGSTYLRQRVQPLPPMSPPPPPLQRRIATIPVYGGPPFRYNQPPQPSPAPTMQVYGAPPYSENRPPQPPAPVYGAPPPWANPNPQPKTGWRRLFGRRRGPSS